jgi:hypothetical protein
VLGKQPYEDLHYPRCMKGIEVNRLAA